MAGGALALGLRRELAEEMWLGVANFMAASTSSGRLHGRLIEDGRRLAAPVWPTATTHRSKARRSRARMASGGTLYRGPGSLGVHGTHTEAGWRPA
jgi:hypothetical protein